MMFPTRKIAVVIACMSLYAASLMFALSLTGDNGSASGDTGMSAGMFYTLFTLTALLPVFVASAIHLWVLGNGEYKRKKFFVVFGLTLPAVALSVAAGLFLMHECWRFIDENPDITARLTWLCKWDEWHESYVMRDIPRSLLFGLGTAVAGFTLWGIWILLKKMK